MLRPGLLLAVLLLAGCSTPAPAPAEDPVSTYSDRFNLVPPGSREVNVEMLAGDAFRAEINAAYDVAWDVHSHPGGQLTTWQEGRGLTATIDFTAPSDGVYSVWIRTTGQITTTVALNMTGQFTLVE